MGELSVLINILGAAALLLWGLRMVGTGVTRAYGANLRRWINTGISNRLRALGAGTVVTLALQSSTATCFMAASFTGRGLMTTATAQAVMLGANIGTSLMVKLLTFNVGPLSALLILGGVAVFRSGEGRRRHLARIAIGLGLMLLSLHLLHIASEPLRTSPQLQAVLHDLDGLWLAGLALAALIALLAHSSIAAILLILPLAAQDSFGLPFGLALVLGSNIGSALSPVLETGHEKAAVRRVPLGNLIVRLGGAALTVPFLDPLAPLLAKIDADPVAVLVNFHILFNLTLSVLALPLTGLIAGLTQRLRPDEAVTDDQRRPRHLDESALGSPTVAIGAATRETLRIGDQIEAMLSLSLDVLRGGTAKQAGELGKMDDVVDSLHEAVKMYLVRLSNEDMGDEERRRASEIMTFAINLEHIGDIIDRNLKELAEKKIKHHLSFSDEGFHDIEAMFALTMSNLRAALAVFVSGDAGLARQLVAEKAEMRRLERSATDAHLSRISSGRRESIETSALHLDILRDLKRINAHITSVAYPILEQRGELERTRLRPAG